jgi:hypothetical protein
MNFQVPPSTTCLNRHFLVPRGRSRWAPDATPVHRDLPVFPGPEGFTYVLFGVRRIEDDVARVAHFRPDEAGSIDMRFGRCAGFPSPAPAPAQPAPSLPASGPAGEPATLNPSPPEEPHDHDHAAHFY